MRSNSKETSQNHFILPLCMIVSVMSPLIDICANTVGVDWTQLVVLKETKDYREIAKYILADKAKVFVDTDSMLVVSLNPVINMPSEAHSVNICLTALGPMSSSPPPLLTGDKPVQLQWNDGRITGSDLVLEPQRLNLRDGMEIQIQVAITLNSQASCTTAADSGAPPTRLATIYVEFKDFGLFHRESDSVIFIRSSQSSGWDTRPGASAMFGWNKRTNHKSGRFWNFVAPMAGVNVSLLDFDRDETIEFGVGPAVSFIQGGLILGTGWNLSTNFRQRRYFFLGVSFVNIASFIKRSVEPGVK